MLFNSLEFLLFYIVVTTIFFLLPHKYRWFHLLIGSCYFYAFFVPIYILILFFTIVIDYFAGIYIEKTILHKKKFLVMSLIANIGILFFFKYFNFFIDNINGITHFFGTSASIPSLNIILPIGLSFHTFQAMSYTIEVYRGNQKAERHFGIYSLYVRNNIKLFFIIAPVYNHHYSRITRNYPPAIETINRKYCNNGAIKLFRFDSLDLNYKKEFFLDNIHLNENGTRKFSLILANELKQYLK